MEIVTFRRSIFTKLTIIRQNVYHSSESRIDEDEFLFKYRIK